MQKNSHIPKKKKKSRCLSAVGAKAMRKPREPKDEGSFHADGDITAIFKPLDRSQELLHRSRVIPSPRLAISTLEHSVSALWIVWSPLFCMSLSLMDRLLTNIKHCILWYKYTGNHVIDTQVYSCRLWLAAGSSLRKYLRIGKAVRCLDSTVDYSKCLL